MNALDRLKAMAANPAPLDDDEEDDGYRGSIIISLYDDGTANLVSDLGRDYTIGLLRHIGRQV